LQYKDNNQEQKIANMYLFFVRHFNDIDHMTPVAWKMIKDGYPVAVYCMEPRYDIAGDYRLKFLKSLGAVVEYLHAAGNRSGDPFYNSLLWLMKKCFKVQASYRARNFRNADILSIASEKMARIVGRLIYKLIRKMYYNTDWARSILEQSAAKAVCFDYVMPRSYVVNAFLKAAGEISVPILSLPHGIQLYTNEATKPKATDTRRLAKFTRFDYIIAPNRLRKEILIKSGVPSEKITVLGSARYCKEWLEQNNKIVPKVLDNKGRSADKLKVVLMPSKPQCRMDMARMINTFNILADLDGIEACIKPHTRTGGSKDIYENIQLPNASNVLTAELCEWADVMLVVGSSVITEALMRGKPALYLKYLHTNTTLAEEMDACWIIHDETELKGALLSLHADKTRLPYDEKNIDRFISEIVHGGAAGSDVLEEYKKLIVSCASNT
jgi:hypothetical protein